VSILFSTCVEPCTIQFSFLFALNILTSYNQGASRYYSPNYRDGFALECKAIKYVRETLGLKNVIVMIPFCRTLTEADRVIEVMAEEGLVRGPDFHIYVMCEIPSNVILAGKNTLQT